MAIEPWFVLQDHILEGEVRNMAKTVAQIFIETLVNAGIKRVYGVVGDSLNGLTDVMRKSKQIEWLHVRHEEVAAFAAGAEAHLTGELAVCAGSCGPGNLHLINGLFDCHRNRVPVLAIAAQIPSHEIGSGYFQETHPEHLFKDCSHYCELVSQAEQMPRVLGIAMRTAIAERGVAVIVIPGDVALRECSAPALSLGIENSASFHFPSDNEVRSAAEILNRATKVTIIGGAGCEGAHAELIAVAERLKAPIVHALRGKEFIEYDNPYDVGMTGLLGFSSGYHAMMNCDALLMLGTDFPYQQFYPRNAKIIQVDRRGDQIGRRTPVDLGLIGNVKDTLDVLTPLIEIRPIALISIYVSATTKMREKALTTSPWVNRVERQSIRNTWRRFWMSWRRKTRCSPATSARRRFGLRAIFT